MSTAMALGLVVPLPGSTGCGPPVVQPPPLSPVRAHGVPARSLGHSTPPVPSFCTRHQGTDGPVTSCTIDVAGEHATLHWSRETDALNSVSQSVSTETVRLNDQVILTWSRRISKPASRSRTPLLIETTTTYGPSVQGIRSSSISVVDGSVQGSVDGRAIVPVRLVPGKVRTLAFADGQPAPRAVLNPAVVSALETLMPQVMHTLDLSVPSNGGDDPGTSFQNGVDDPWTSDCQGCFRTCGTNVFDWFVPGAYWACLAGCYAPVIGGCGEKYCSAFASCDSNQTCCGDLCCGPSDVCGNDQFGACCPQAFPVGCGDETKVLCYPAGSTCCGFTDACEAGTQCQHVPGTSDSSPPRCCPNDKVCDSDCCAAGESCLRTSTGAGVCCAGQLCGGACCLGTCIGGQCCPTSLGAGASTACGPSCCPSFMRCIDLAQGTCCFPSKACGTKCCGESESCAGGACCPSDLACGSVCCQPGFHCSDPQSSTCTPIALTCAAGQAPCFPRGEDSLPLPGATPICCPTGAACCSGPPPTCCTGSSQECHSAIKEPLGCKIPVCASGNPSVFCNSNADCPGSFCPTASAVTCRPLCLN
jgi:hypothetical protein